MRRFFVSAAALLWILSVARGCECGPPGPACAYIGHADVAFIGTVAFTDHDPTLGLRQSTLVKFHVEEAFKGISSSEPDVWIDPGSFSSCYAEYKAGQRWLVFGYRGARMPQDTAAMSIVPGQSGSKPLPKEIDLRHPPIVYEAPECSGTRYLSPSDNMRDSDYEFLHKYKAGSAASFVSGDVLDPELPLPGVLVTLAGARFRRSTLTDEKGHYVFSDVPSGAYGFTASLPPYFPNWTPASIELSNGSCEIVDFRMIAPGIIEGTLVDRRGFPVPGVEVEVLRIDSKGDPVGNSVRNTTDRAGRFQAIDLPSGNFEAGINIYHSPEPDHPNASKRWAEGEVTSIHLEPGEHRTLSPLLVSPRLAVRRVNVQVRWPDGRPAKDVLVSAMGGRWAEGVRRTDTHGRARFDFMEGLPYRVFTDLVSVGSEQFSSGEVMVTPGASLTKITFVLRKQGSSR